jgi:hypothetical protein
MSDSIMGDIASPFIHGKDRGLAVMGQFLANRLALSRYGEMSKFRIDTQTKEFHLELRLKGETEPLLLRVLYHLERYKGKRSLVFHRVSSSREWVNLLINDFIQEHPFRIELPPPAALAACILGL